MNNEEKVLKILEIIYSRYSSDFPLFLEGGALCCLFWKVDRLFSGDIDFTTSIDNIHSILDYYFEILSKEISISVKKINENQYFIVFDDNSKIQIDIYYAPPENCEYTIVDLRGISVRCHSMEDMIAEKACCMITRRKENDCLDYNFLIKNPYIDMMKVAELLEKKKIVKKIL